MKRLWLSMLVMVHLSACGDGERVDAQSASASVEPTLSVVPNTDLLHEQEVQVTGSGFAPNMEVLLTQCYGSFGNRCGWSQRLPTDTTGSFQSSAVVARFYQLPWGDLVSCAEPEACGVWALVGTQIREVRLTFRDIPFAKGTLQVEPSTVSGGELVTVTGSGWTPGGFVRLAFGALAASASDFDGGESPIDENGNVRSVIPVSYLARLRNNDNAEVDATLVDCTVSPPQCGVLAFDTRAPETTQVVAPVSVRAVPVARGTASLDLPSPLVNALVARVVGTGWAANSMLEAWVCKGPSLVGCHPAPWFTARGIRVDAAGNLRVYQQLYASLQEGLTAEVNCASEPGCTLLIADPRALEATRVHIPLSFVEGDAFDVVSRYSAAEEEWFQEGLQLTGSTEAAFQTTSAQRTLWILALAGVSTGGKRPREGTFSHTSTYSYTEYVVLTAQAARFDYTLDEVQKVGSLFWSWFIQGLPDPGP